MTIAYRYRILFYHQNQRWVRKVVPLIDVSAFLLFLTDSPTSLEKQLETGEVDIILTAFNAKHFVLREDEQQSLTYKEAPIWEVVESHGLPTQIILLCTQKEQMMAADLVHAGKVADYCVVNPLIDRNRLYLSIMRALEGTMLRDVVEQKVLRTEEVPRDLAESVEMLQTLRNTPDEGEEEAPITKKKRREKPAFIPQEQSLDDNFLVHNPTTKPKKGAGMSASSVFSSLNDDTEEPDPDELQVQEDVDDEPELNTRFTAKSVFSSLDDEDEESMGIRPENVFSSLRDDDPPEERKDVIGQMQSAFTPTEENTGQLVSDKWTRMRKSEFEVLLVEHHLDNIQLVMQSLARQGLKTMVANSAAEALFYLNKEIFELMLVTIDLPDQNGLDLLNRIRSKGPQSDIPAIVMSDRALSDHVVKSFRVGANHFIVKPLNPARLVENVQKLLRRTPS